MNAIFGILAKPLALILTALYDLTNSYGISIIILTVAVKIILYPFYKKQMLSTMGMTELGPKIQALQRQYAGDSETLNIKMQELYKEEGVNPAAGCLPMVIQMVIIMGLFTLLRSPLSYIKTPKMIFAIHESFLWINDLSQSDPWVLPILAGIATFVSFYLSSNNGSMPGGTGPGQGKVMTALMKYGFPIMIIWLAKTYAAGLASYWFLSQFIQIFYNLRFNQIKEKMNKEKESKGKKHSKRKTSRA